VQGERKPVTILFADIVGSTSLAEKLDPEEVTKR
jgi:class 3 adenylate cyclase